MLSRIEKKIPKTNFSRATNSMLWKICLLLGLFEPFIVLIGVWASQGFSSPIPLEVLDAVTRKTSPALYVSLILFVASVYFKYSWGINLDEDRLSFRSLGIMVIFIGIIFLATFYSLFQAHYGEIVETTVALLGHTTLVVTILILFIGGAVLLFLSLPDEQQHTVLGGLLTVLAAFLLFSPAYLSWFFTSKSEMGILTVVELVIFIIGILLAYFTATRWKTFFRRTVY